MPASFYALSSREETAYGTVIYGNGNGALAKISDGTKRRMLVAGAAGRIGSYFAEHTRDKYALRLMVRGDEDGIDRIRPYREVAEADLVDLERLKAICAGADTTVHLAGDPKPSAYQLLY